MNGKYYNNPTFMTAEESALVDKKDSIIDSKIFVTFTDSNLWHDKIFEGSILNEENNILKIKTTDGMILLPTKYINYIEHINK